MTASPDFAALWPVADALADAARAETLAHFRATDLAAESKQADFDPVTEADRAAERAMRAVLARERPDDGITGEEYGATPSTTGVTWILDPIDGTRGYLAGTPTWGTLIAAADADGPKLGIVDQPWTGERFSGGAGRAGMTGPGGARTLATRGPRPLQEAILFTTFPEVGSDEEGAAFRRVASDVRLIRYGMDCYAYALLAMGCIDLVIEAGLQVYDIAAPMAVVEAAGGIVTDWTGGSATAGGRVIAAANAEVHGRALERLGA